jgi:AbrB family looped-hinge helix DNA binding protein
MANVSTTKMSSKGQVVIPENIRKQLNLKPGAQFVVIGKKDVVILKNIAPPSFDEFGALIVEARKKGKQFEIKKSDISDAILKARGKKKGTDR